MIFDFFFWRDFIQVFDKLMGGEFRVGFTLRIVQLIKKKADEILIIQSMKPKAQKLKFQLTAFHLLSNINLFPSAQQNKLKLIHIIK